MLSVLCLTMLYLYSRCSFCYCLGSHITAPENVLSIVPYWLFLCQYYSFIIFSSYIVSRFIDSHSFQGCVEKFLVFFIVPFQFFSKLLTAVFFRLFIHFFYLFPLFMIFLEILICRITYISFPLFLFLFHLPFTLCLDSTSLFVSSFCFS